MDPITAAIVAGLTAGAMAGLTDMGKNAVTDAYEHLKSLLTRKTGKASAVSQAVEQLEHRPDSAARKAVLQEEMVAAKADQDPELCAAAQALLKTIGTQPGGEHHIQNATGSYIAQAEQGSSASVNVSPL